MSILVTGATGGVGACVVQGLLAAGLDVRAFSRDPARARLPAGVQVVPGDLREPESLARALTGVRGVFLYAHAERLPELMQTLRRARVEQVVVLSTIDATNDRPYARHNRERHVAVENAVAAAGFRHTFLRPGAFARNAHRFWGEAIAVAGPIPMPYPDAQQAPIDERDIAAVAVHALASRDLDGQALVLTGPDSLTQRQQLACIAAALGRTLRIQTESLDDARARLARSVPSAYVELLLAQWAEEVGAPAVVSDAVERITGRPATTYREWAQRHAAAFLVPSSDRG
jgi:uncharacterized protein YbjT (DUF2867 family)